MSEVSLQATGLRQSATAQDKEALAKLSSGQDVCTPRPGSLGKGGSNAPSLGGSIPSRTCASPVFRLASFSSTGRPVLSLSRSSDEYLQEGISNS